MYIGDTHASIPREITLGELETQIENLRAEIDNIRDSSNKVFILKLFIKIKIHNLNLKYNKLWYTIIYCVTKISVFTKLDCN